MSRFLIFFAAFITLAAISFATEEKDCAAVGEYCMGQKKCCDHHFCNFYSYKCASYKLPVPSSSDPVVSGRAEGQIKKPFPNSNCKIMGQYCFSNQDCCGQKCFGSVCF